MPPRPLRPALVLLLACAPLASADPSLESLREAGRWKQLRARVTPWLAQSPEDPNALLWMSQVKQAFGDLEGAYGLITKAAKARPEDAAIQAQLASTAGQKAQSASALSQLSLAREMRKAGEKALALNPRDVDTANMMMQFYWMAPGIVGGDKEKAKALAAQVSAFDPVRGLLMQADLALKEKDRAKAEGFMKQAATKPGATAPAILAYASFLANGEPKRVDEALVQARRAVALEPGRASGHAMVAALLAVQGKFAEMEAALAAAEKAAPENPLPLYTVARTLISEGKEYARAEALLRRYLAKEPEGGAPDHAAARWRLGQALDKQGRKAEAVAELEAALARRPDLKGAKEDLKRLKG
jgi:tetratricopeptide (TPR) repeat protein